MKSAFELAMARFGGEVRELTPEQKEQLAEIDRRADAKIAELRLRSPERIGQAPADHRAEVQQQVAEEIRKAEERRERDKERLRASFAEAD